MSQLEKMMKFYEEVKKYHDLLEVTTQQSPFWLSFYACEIAVGNDETDINHVWQMAAPMICELAESYGFDVDRNQNSKEEYGELVINCRDNTLQIRSIIPQSLLARTLDGVMHQNFKHKE